MTLLILVTLPFASTVTYGTVNDPEKLGEALADVPYEPALAPLSFKVVTISIFLVPSNEADPVTSFETLMVLAVSNLVADPAFPVTVVGVAGNVIAIFEIAVTLPLASTVVYGILKDLPNPTLVAVPVP